MFAQIKLALFRFRHKVAPFYNKINVWKQLRQLQRRVILLENNFYYEAGITHRLNAPKVLSLPETMDEIKNKKKSIWRYGDGEFNMVCGHHMGFQMYNEKLSARLREILASEVDGGLCLIPNIFASLAHFNDYKRPFWRGVLEESALECLSFFNPKMTYGDTFVTRPWQECPACGWTRMRVFDEWKEVFRDQEILLVEGRFSRLGVGNDLFATAASIMRIWCPPTDAFSYYDVILDEVKKHAQGKLILIALGATATVLAYDLCKSGYWAIDIGHLDLEYIWMKMGVQEKCAIPGRYVNELCGGKEMIPIKGEAKTLNVVSMIGIGEEYQ